MDILFMGKGGWTSDRGGICLAVTGLIGDFEDVIFETKGWWKLSSSQKKVLLSD